MAVTGQGTEESPYLVRNHDEIGEAFELVKEDTGSGTRYIELVNHIDGNWGTWTSLSAYVRSNQCTIDFNLANHYIRNFKIGGYGTALEMKNGDVIRNGQIYNFNCDRGSNFLRFMELNKVSASFLTKDLSSRALDAVKIKKSAVWIKANKMVAGYSPMIIQFPVGVDSIDESDVKIIIDELDLSSASGSGFVIFESFSPSNPIVGENCRISGEIGSITGSTIPSYPAIASSSVAFEDSVISFEMPAYSGTVSSGQATTIVAPGTTGVINSTLIHESTYAEYTMLNLIPVTNTEIYSADDLTQKGFTTYDISPNE